MGSWGNATAVGKADRTGKILETGVLGGAAAGAGGLAARSYAPSIPAAAREAHIEAGRAHLKDLGEVNRLKARGIDPVKAAARAQGSAKAEGRAAAAVPHAIERGALVHRVGTRVAAAGGLAALASGVALERHRNKSTKPDWKPEAKPERKDDLARAGERARRARVLGMGAHDSQDNLEKPLAERSPGEQHAARQEPDAVKRRQAAFGKSAQNAAVKGARRVAERGELVRRGLRSAAVGTGKHPTFDSGPAGFKRGVIRNQAREDYLKGRQFQRDTIAPDRHQTALSNLSEAAEQRGRPFGMNAKQSYANTREHVRRARDARLGTSPRFAKSVGDWKTIDQRQDSQYRARRWKRRGLAAAGTAGGIAVAEHVSHPGATSEVLGRAKNYREYAKPSLWRPTAPSAANKLKAAGHLIRGASTPAKVVAGGAALAAGGVATAGAARAGESYQQRRINERRKANVGRSRGGNAAVGRKQA